MLMRISHRTLSTRRSPARLPPAPARLPLRHQMHRLLLQIHAAGQLRRPHRALPRHPHHRRRPRTRPHIRRRTRHPTPLERLRLVLARRPLRLRRLQPSHFPLARIGYSGREGVYPQAQRGRSPALSTMPHRPPSTGRSLVRGDAARAHDTARGRVDHERG